MGGADRQPSAGPDLGSAIVLTPAPASLAELKRHLFGALPRFERIIADHLGHDPAIAGRVELLDAADVLRQEIGLRPAPWTQGIARHGWVHAVAAMVIAVARPAGEIIVSRAALLDGMLARDPAALHPWPSLHRIRKLPHEVDLDATPPAAPRPAAPIAPKLPFAPPPVAVAEAPPANIATAIAALAAMPSAERARWYQRAQPHLGRTVPGEWTQPARWAHAVTADLAAAGLLAGPARGPTPSDLAGP